MMSFKKKTGLSFLSLGISLALSQAPVMTAPVMTASVQTAPADLNLAASSDPSEKKEPAALHKKPFSSKKRERNLRTSLDIKKRALFLKLPSDSASGAEGAEKTEKKDAAIAPRFLKQDSKQRAGFPFIYNREIQRWIQVFSDNEAIMSLWLARSARYFPLMQRVLKRRGLPSELACVTLVESNLSASAVSPARAVGYWQFIAPTARRFQLTVNDWLDERRDFEKSARAAARYLEVLNTEFDDWPLSLAAYNMGETRLRRLIQKYKTRDFWRLARKSDFPRETAHYVPKVFAACNILKSPESRGFTQFSVLKPYQYDLFYAPGGTDLKILAKQTGRTLAELKALNPELKTGRIPPNIQNHRIRLPEGTAPLFSACLDKQRRRSPESLRNNTQCLSHLHSEQDSKF